MSLFPKYFIEHITFFFLFFIVFIISHIMFVFVYLLDNNEIKSIPLYKTITLLG